jgi:hypothetical protein
MNARSVATWANAERAARRGREWTEQVKPHFGFLEAYRFAVAMASAADWWEVTGKGWHADRSDHSMAAWRRCDAFVQDVREDGISG